MWGWADGASCAYRSMPAHQGQGGSPTSRKLLSTTKSGVSLTNGSVSKASGDGEGNDTTVAVEQTCNRFQLNSNNIHNVRSHPTPRRVFDCFLASHELDMMEIRMRELEAVVDAFVIVESRMTFRGRSKPLYLPRIMPKLSASVLEKISYYVLDNLPADDPWDRETIQRNALLGPGLLRLQPRPGDVLVVSDCDEIPKPDFLLALKHCAGVSYPLTMQAIHHYYSFALKSNSVDKVWNKPDAMLYRNPLQLTAQQLRSLQNKTVYPNSSWHCSTCFSHIESVRQKIASFSHSEFDVPEYKNAEDIINRVRNGLDLFNRPHMQFVRDDSGDMPEYIKEHPTRFSHLISRDAVDAGFKDIGSLLTNSSV